jgi:hypothetical protein
MIPYPNQFEILSEDERIEQRSLVIKMNVWLGYCENCRKSKSAINYEKDLANHEYYRLQELREKVWGPLPR